MSKDTKRKKSLLERLPDDFKRGGEKAVQEDIDETFDRVERKAARSSAD